MPKSFDFTLKNKINLIQSFLGPMNIKDTSEIPALIQAKMNKEMQVYEAETKALEKLRIQEKLQFQIQQLNESRIQDQ
jgi:hypothetical protein